VLVLTIIATAAFSSAVLVLTIIPAASSPAVHTQHTADQIQLSSALDSSAASAQLFNHPHHCH